MSVVTTPIDTTHPEGRLDDELLAFVRRQMDEHHVPGVAIGVAHGDSVAVAGLGVTSVANPLPVDGDTLFRIASITKTMTGTAVMQLVEQGRLELDAPVRHYLPDFAVADEEVSRAVTVRGLLTHTGGWEGDHFEDTGWGDDAVEVFVRRMRKLQQESPFRTMWSYNNAGFSVLGRILEVLHDEPYDALMRRVLFAPLGIEDATFWGHDVLLHRFAVGHAVAARGLQVARPWAHPRSSDPVGGVVCGVRELLRYARFQLGTLTPEQPVLEDATRELMQRPAAPDAVNGDGIGLTWHLRTVGGGRVIGHQGDAHGMPCDLWLHPDHGLAIAVLTNGHDRDHRVARSTVRWAQARYLGLANPAPEPDPEAFGDLDAVTGTYQSYLDRHTVRRVGDEVHIESGETFAWLDGLDPPRSGRTRRFIPVAPDVLAEIRDGDGSNATFYRDESGAVRWLHLDMRAAPRA
jgi:CubicO group peptidase (beta-lactamase class C family)